MGKFDHSSRSTLMMLDLKAWLTTFAQRYSIRFRSGLMADYFRVFIDHALYTAVQKYSKKKRKPENPSHIPVLKHRVGSD